MIARATFADPESDGPIGVKPDCGLTFGSRHSARAITPSLGPSCLRLALIRIRPARESRAARPVDIGVSGVDGAIGRAAGRCYRNRRTEEANAGSQITVRCDKRQDQEQPSNSWDHGITPCWERGTSNRRSTDSGGSSLGQTRPQQVPDEQALNSSPPFPDCCRRCAQHLRQRLVAAPPPRRPTAPLLACPDEEPESLSLRSREVQKRRLPLLERSDSRSQVRSSKVPDSTCAAAVASRRLGHSALQRRRDVQQRRTPAVAQAAERSPADTLGAGLPDLGRGRVASGTRAAAATSHLPQGMLPRLDDRCVCHSPLVCLLEPSPCTF